MPKDPLLIDTIRHLYEGPNHPMGMPLAEDVTFRDPLVVVQGRRQVLRLFGRLNTLLPASTIHTFETLDPSAQEYLMLMHYRRRSGAPARPFKTRLHIQQDGGLIVAVAENWLAPLLWSADSGSAFIRLARRGIGRMLSTNFTDRP